MIIKGFEKLSLSDFPGHLACVIFTPGCSLLCPFCHNRDLVKNSPRLKTVSESEVFEFLNKRKNILEGVVVTGGEPTLQLDLIDFLGKVKSSGYKTKLDTNGTRPDVLKKVLGLGLADFLAIDVKTVLNVKEYEKLGLKTGLSPILESLKLAGKSSLPLELRTTVVPKLHDEKIIRGMAKQLAKIFKDRFPSPRHPEGIANPKDLKPKIKWVLQTFRPGTCLDEKYNNEKPYSAKEMQNLLEKAKPIFPAVSLR